MTTSQTLAHQAELLAPIEATSAKMGKALAAYLAASAAAQAAISAGLAGGVGVADVCRASGLSRARVYQIRDNGK